MNHLVSSIPKDVFLRTSYVECQQSIATQTAQEVNVELGSSVTRRVQFTDTKEEYEPSLDCSSGEETLSGESCTFRMTFWGDNVEATKGQNVVRGVDFRATNGQNFVRGREKHHKQIRRRRCRIHRLK